MIGKPEDLLKGFVQLSSLPVIYTKMNEAVNNPQSSMKDISDIISDDPGPDFAIAAACQQRVLWISIKSGDRKPCTLYCGYTADTRPCVGDFHHERV